MSQGRLADLAARLRASGCVFAEDEAELLIAAAACKSELDVLVARRISGEPLEPILGWVAFGGLRLAIGPGVFVPRRRTELLATTAAELADQASAIGPTVVVDLGCGCGAIAAVVAARVPAADLFAVDVDPTAAEWTRRNVPTATVTVGDLFVGLPGNLNGRIDVIAANGPYVPTSMISSLPPEARDHEPMVTLDGGVDGLDVLRRVLTGASKWLAPGGTVVVETSEDQAMILAVWATTIGLSAAIDHDDDIAGTVVVARRAADAGR